MLKRLIKGERGIKANPETKSDGLKSNSRRTSPQLYFFFLPLMNKLVRKLFFFCFGDWSNQVGQLRRGKSKLCTTLNTCLDERKPGRALLFQVRGSVYSNDNSLPDGIPCKKED